MEKFAISTPIGGRGVRMSVKAKFGRDLVGFEPKVAESRKFCESIFLNVLLSLLSFYDIVPYSLILSPIPSPPQFLSIITNI